jgi:hypothetical protein
MKNRPFAFAATAIAYLLILQATTNSSFAQTGRVGIGTTQPGALLHVADSNVLFTGPTAVPATTLFFPPASGAGTRMMWYPQMGAFRVGTVQGPQGSLSWDKINIGINSFASGYNTKASGEYSTSMGYASSSSGEYSTSLGFETSATGPYATSLGNLPQPAVKIL